MSDPGPSPAVFGYAHVLPIYGIDRLALQPFLAPGLNGLEDTPAHRAREIARVTFALNQALALIRQAPLRPPMLSVLDSLPALVGHDAILQAHDLIDDFLASQAGLDARYPSPPPGVPDPAFALTWVRYSLNDLFKAERGSEFDLPFHSCYQAAMSAARAYADAGATTADHLGLLRSMQALEVSVEPPPLSL